MFFKVLCRSLILLCMVSFCLAEEAVFYDAQGNPMTRQQYEEASRKRTEKLKRQKVKRRQQLSAAKANAKATEQARKAKKRSIPRTAVRARAKTKPKMQYDEFGRPLFDSEGNMISYQYYVVYKVCTKCNAYIPLATRDGQPCPKCGEPWHWPKETGITEKGIRGIK